jgi:hypothetical protein
MGAERTLCPGLRQHGFRPGAAFALAAEDYPPLYLSGALLRGKSEYYAALASVQLQGDVASSRSAAGPSPKARMTTGAEGWYPLA